MDRGSFRDLVTSITKFSGVAYAEDATQINRIINERLRKFSERTWCLYDDAVSFQTAAATGLYDLRGSSFSRELIQIDKVFIEGRPLQDFQGCYGPVRLDELVAFYPSYLTQVPSRPVHFCHIPPKTIRLFPVPDASFSDCFVSGWYFPSPITLAASGDGIEIEIPEEFQRTAAYYTAASLLLPTSTGQADYEKMAVLSQEAAKEMQQLESRSRRLIMGPSIRGSVRRWF